MVHRVENLSVEEISLVDEPANKGARVVLLKRDARTNHHEEIERMSEAIEKCVRDSLRITGEESDRELARKRVIKRALDEGLTTITRIAAEQSLEQLAKALRAADPALSPERAFVRAMETEPELAAAAMG